MEATRLWLQCKVLSGVRVAELLAFAKRLSIPTLLSAKLLVFADIRYSFELVIHRAML